MNKCPYCQNPVIGDFAKHLDSLACKMETEINSDPVLRYNLKEAHLDYHLLDHQIGIQMASFKIAINRTLNRMYPTNA